ncbi:MAG: UDP-N-acetylmuramate dehydrogenase [Chlamydiales bacterium]
MQKSQIQVREHISLISYSTFRIGGKARFLAEAHSTKDMQELFCFAKKLSIPLFIIGKGSNTLFDDQGYSGLIIINKMKKKIVGVNSLYVESGYSFSRLGQEITKLGFSGFEFAIGIPGSVGGALYMNAGAHGFATADLLDSVEFLHSSGEVHQWQRKDLEFGYRYSSFQKIPGSILTANFILLQQDVDSIDLQKRNIKQRILSQPYREKSCGCIFRNPPGFTAGKIIDMCGLKGLSIGDAAVSDIHANFIINRGAATSSNVLELIQLIQSCALMRFDCNLQPEIRYVPYQSF